MPGMYHLQPAKYNGKLYDLWLCDRCRRVYGFEHNEKLFCPRCKDDGYPMNADPDKGESAIIKP